MNIPSIPLASYGVLQQDSPSSILDEAVEQIRNLGYAILDSGYDAARLKALSIEFDRTRELYLANYGDDYLRGMGEFYTIRSLLTHGGEYFLNLALNENLLHVLKQLIPGKFILNQQNGLINPPKEGYNQGAWHRDLPYQHFVSSKPLAINALYCVDDFTLDNGATFLLPASHKSEAFPSDSYIRENAIQIEAKAGSYIVLDCMVFHAGGFNHSNIARRTINHLYNIPFFKQQINIPMNMKGVELSAEARDILGYDYLEAASISDYLSKRVNKI